METIIDTIDLEAVAGFDIRAEIVTTEDGLDGDYPADVRLAYDEGEWQIVDLIVTASRGGIALGSDRLGGVEYGQFPKPDSSDWYWVDPLRDSCGTLATYRSDMIDNAVADARMTLSNLVDAAIDTAIDGGN